MMYCGGANFGYVMDVTTGMVLMSASESINVEHRKMDYWPEHDTCAVFLYNSW